MATWQGNRLSATVCKKKAVSPNHGSGLVSRGTCLGAGLVREPNTDVEQEPQQGNHATRISWR